ncbi:TonB-dependent receptor [Myxococcus faecalis]|uniref:TonB-dependent receptor domain-containing protein n=1 Tax=Myxococcus TaxID=32 RepID=UPI001CBC7CC2|nr:TonB-dependent receptor [Myxococcus sp. AS-1-15]
MKNLTVSQLARVCGVVGVLVGVAWAPTTRAEEATDVIVGKVVDAVSQLPVPDVVVTAMTAELPEENTVVTDVEGTYRIPSVPPGTYTLLFEHELYIPLRRTEVRKLAGQELRVDVLLEQGSPDEWEDILYCGPTVADDSSSSVSTDLSTDLGFSALAQRPLAGRRAMRTLEGFLLLASNMVETRQGSTLLGTSPWENEYLLDGLSTRDAVTGRNALPLSLEFLQDATVFTHGLRAQQGGATGVIVEQNSSSGSNDLRGHAFIEWVPGVLAESGHVNTRLGEPSVRRAVLNQGAFGVTLHGPVAKDKLWFFMGVVPALARVEQTPTEHAGGSRSFIDHREVQALGRLTYLLNYDHNLSLIAVTAPSLSRWQTVESASGEVDRDTSRVALDYNGAFFEKRLLLDAHAGWLGQRVTTSPPREHRPAEETGSVCGGSVDDWPMDCDVGDQATHRYQASARAMYSGEIWGLLHIPQMGVSVERGIHRWERNTLVATPLPETHSGFVSAYLQDTWSPSDWLTFNTGLRYDAQSVGGRIHGGDVASHTLSPRLGVTMSSSTVSRGQQQLRIFANYARYHGRVLLSLLRPHQDTEGVVTNVRLAPSLTPPATTEWVTGVEFAPEFITSASIVYARRIRTAGLQLIQDLERGDLLLVNPGRGLGAEFPAPRSRHDSVTFEVDRNFHDSWSMLLAYTWSRLQGATLEEQRGILNRPHVLKLSGSRTFNPRNGSWGVSVGASYVGIAGARIGTTEQHEPWMHTVDARLAVRYNVERRQAIEFHLDVLNVFDSQDDDSLASDREVAILPAYQTPRQVRLGARYAF